jgi:hypothetical protein
MSKGNLSLGHIADAMNSGTLVAPLTSGYVPIKEGFDDEKVMEKKFQYH